MAIIIKTYMNTLEEQKRWIFFLRSAVTSRNIQIAYF